MKKVEKDGRQISKTQKTLKNLQELSAETAAQLSEMRTEKETTLKDAVSLENRLKSIRAEVRSGLDSLELERGGLESINQQTAAIRTSLADMERRQSELEHSNRSVAEATGTCGRFGGPHGLAGDRHRSGRG